jgi:serine/threonine protein kinase
MVVGKMPFFEEYEKDLVMAIQHKEVDIPDWLGDDVKHFLHRCLEKNPLKRANTQELQHLAYIQRVMPEPEETSPPPHTYKSCRASP